MAAVAPSEKKAEIIPEQGDPIPCMFNPNEITIRKTNSWKPQEKKGGNAPTLEFDSGKAATMKLSLMFDTSMDGKPVTDVTNKLLEAMAVNPDLPGSDDSKNKARPPSVQFRWGRTTTFPMAITSATIKFTYFANDGTPLRAKADLQLTQLEDTSANPLQNPTSHTPYPHRIHHVTRGETLDRIASLYYDDPTRWRELAVANEITNPLSLTPGTPIIVPQRRVVRRG